MTLLQTQIAFTKLLPRLINFCFERNYEAVAGELFRPKETVQIYAAQGRGSKTSVHPEKLALDLSLFINGNLLTKTESYQEVGEYWESLGTEEVKTVWGGRFQSRPDGNHFSVEWQGRK